MAVICTPDIIKANGRVSMGIHSLIFSLMAGPVARSVGIGNRDRSPGFPSFHSGNTPGEA